MFDPNGRPPQEWRAYQVIGVCLTVGGMLGGAVTILLDNPLWLLLTVSPAVLAGSALVLEARLILWCLHNQDAQPRPQLTARITTRYGPCGGAAAPVLPMPSVPPRCLLAPRR